MIVYDELYGKYQIEGVLEELINSPEVQRLKDIHMIGPSYLLNPLWNETRYEHSIGVMLLIKKLGGNIEEQIAGVLHDISHTVFSHVIDMVMKRNKEDYHEIIKEKYIENSTLPSILKKWGYGYTEILFDDSKWKILEQDAPLLCADRMDYTLREVYRYFGTSIKEIHSFLSNVSFEANQIVLQNVSDGEWFIKEYYKVVLDLFYNPTNMYGYEIMSKILSHSLQNKFLSPDDLMKTESEILTYLKSIHDEQLEVLFNEFYSDILFKEVTSEQDYDIYQKKKTRLIDPIVKIDSRLLPTSSCSEVARQMNEDAKNKSMNGVYLSLITNKKESIK